MDPDPEQGSFFTNSTSAGVQASFWMLLEKTICRFIWSSIDIDVDCIPQNMQIYVAGLPASMNI